MLAYSWVLMSASSLSAVRVFLAAMAVDKKRRVATAVRGSRSRIATTMRAAALVGGLEKGGGERRGRYLKETQ